MGFNFLKADFRITSRKFVSVVILVSTTWAWLFMFFIFFPDIFQLHIHDLGTVYNGFILFLGAAVISAIIGTIISEKINRKKFLISWIVVGLFANTSLIFSQELGLLYFYLISVVLGISLGLGFPSCLAFLADCTAVGERARVTGIALFLALVIAMLSFIVASASNFGIELLLLLSTVKGTGLIAFVSSDCERTKQEKIRSWKSILTSKDFILYLFPWLLFSFAGSLNNLIFADPPTAIQEIDTIAYMVYFLTWAVFALISGIMADRIGRKQPIMIGLISLGVSYAILAIYTDPATFILFRALSGVAWGFLFTVYITLLGDLASYGSKEKFFAMGAIMPMILTLSCSTLIGLYNITAPITILSPVYSFILFLSVFPVLRATETLPRKEIQNREIQDHLNKVGKLIEESKE